MLKYHGGKHYLAPLIRQHMPITKRYAEPFFGSGAVLFSGDGVGVSEYVNDINMDLMIFWKVLRDQFEEFVRIVDTVPFGEPSFAEWEQMDVDCKDLVRRAVRFFVLNRQSRQGLGTCFATPTERLRRGMNENVSAWMGAVEGLSDVCSRLRRVEICCESALSFIKTYDSPDTFFYCDPPYVHSSRVSTSAYKHEMTDMDHIKLVETLRGIKGRFMISGYDNPLYYKLGTRIELNTINRASVNNTNVVEVLWINY